MLAMESVRGISPKGARHGPPSFQHAVGGLLHCTLHPPYSRLPLLAPEDATVADRYLVVPAFGCLQQNMRCVVPAPRPDKLELVPPRLDSHEYATKLETKAVETRKNQTDRHLTMRITSAFITHPRAHRNKTSPRMFRVSKSI